MLFEDDSTKCPTCKNPLTWQSHITRSEQAGEVHEFTFRCESCRREYCYKNHELTEKQPKGDPAADALAVEHGQLLAAINRRCPNCGGPITNPNGLYLFRCVWCHEEYRVIDGELRVAPPPAPQPKTTLKEVANAIHNGW